MMDGKEGENASFEENFCQMIQRMKRFVWRSLETGCERWDAVETFLQKCKECCK